MKGKWIYIGALLFGFSMGMGGWFGVIGINICVAMMIIDQIKGRNLKEYENGSSDTKSE